MTKELRVALGNLVEGLGSSFCEAFVVCVLFCNPPAELQLGDRDQEGAEYQLVCART